MNKTELMQVRDALSINRVMAKDSDGNYTREVTPKLITAAIAICEADLARVDEPEIFVDPGLFETFKGLPDRDDGFGKYLPIRSTSAGKFTKPLYAAPQEAVAPGWLLVPTVGCMVTADHPITCLNPDKVFEVSEVRYSGDGSMFDVRGENTCWFGIRAIKPAPEPKP